MKKIHAIFSLITYLLQPIIAHIFQPSFSNPLKLSNGYIFCPTVGKLYKVHKIKLTWEDALIKCYDEGAVLAYPKTYHEATVINELYKKEFPNCWNVYFLGFHDKIQSRDFLLLNGQSIINYYHEWLISEPNDVNSRCGSMSPYEGKLTDCDCKTPRNFVCEKDDNLDADYTCSDEMDYCYKIHLEKQTWGVASVVCLSEGGRLAIVTSSQVESFISNLICEQSIYMFDHTWNDIVLIGHHQTFKPGVWFSTSGLPINSYGYLEWFDKIKPPNEPDKCGAMHETGPTMAVSCASPNYFVCEKPNPARKTCCPYA